jgi:NAD(P)-dependent dehydrogenase (short-subunit alcohol dehydrogenase family)
MAGRLAGKVVLISGTGRGLGRAAALVFAGEGAQVFGCGRNQEAADETVKLVREAGGTMSSLAPVDLTTPEGASAWIEAGVAEFGRIDVLYNNASAIRHARFNEQPLADWHFTIDHELHLPYLCTRAAWSHLEVRGGVIINMGSVAGIRGVKFQPMTAHGVTKAAMISMTRHLAAAGAGLGIRAVSITPGMIRSDATNRYFDDADSPIPALIEQTPSGRVGEPEEVARLAAFLASDDAAFINGANIVIDGGISAMGG